MFQAICGRQQWLSDGLLCTVCNIITLPTVYIHIFFLYELEGHLSIRYLDELAKTYFPQGSYVNNSFQSLQNSPTHMMIKKLEKY